MVTLLPRDSVEASEGFSKYKFIVLQLRDPFEDFFVVKPFPPLNWRMEIRLPLGTLIDNLS